MFFNSTFNQISSVLFFLLSTVPVFAAGWTESGELAYSYAYARTVLGHRMRAAGWVCKLGFTAGKNGEQEHSVWVKGSRKMQLMIWKIDSSRTGYSKGEITGGDDKRK